MVKIKFEQVEGEWVPEEFKHLTFEGLQQILFVQLGRPTTTQLHDLYIANKCFR